MTVTGAYEELFTKLRQLYQDAEALNITDWVIEYITGLNKSARRIAGDTSLTPHKEIVFNEVLTRLLDHTPVQYVLHEAYFNNLKFYVDENVLIPRPETEELVHWIVEDQRKQAQPISILDIGTGSGCIPITLKRQLPDAVVNSVDVSSLAIEVAKKNCEIHNTKINFFNLDFLDESCWTQLPIATIIASNPPYVKSSEAAGINRNVLDHEPHLALFVPDEDALVFYRKIAVFGLKHLPQEGKIYVEINEALGSQVIDLFEKLGYSTALRQDMQGKDRMVKAEKPQV